MIEVTGYQMAVVRDCLGLTQADLAGELGVHPNTLARYERGEVSIPMSVEKLLGHVWVGALYNWALFRAEYIEWDELDEEEQEQWGYHEGEKFAFCQYQANRTIDDAWRWYSDILELDDDEEVPFWRNDLWNGLCEVRGDWLQDREDEREMLAEDE